MTYATQTGVTVDRTKGHIEALLMRFGASGFGYMTGDRGAVIAFRYEGLAVKLDLPLPDPASPEFTLTPSGRRQRKRAEALRAWETACRSRWRALLLVIRAKLEAIEAGISTVEREFLPFIVCHDGRTMAQHLLPNLAETVARGPMLMLGLPEGQP